jgi:hypothetical protein
MAKKPKTPDLPKQGLDLESLARSMPSAGSLSTEELQAIVKAETSTGILPGELPAKAAVERERGLESPSYMATEIIDPWYKKQFEPNHYKMMDEVLGPWCLGETVTFEGSTFDPKNFRGLLVLAARNSLKSSMLRLTVLWHFAYQKIRKKSDERVGYIHQVIEKSIEHSIAIRLCAQTNKKWRECYPEFRGPQQKEWDERRKWRWPSFASYGATEYSWTSYGETSSKEGGHYTIRFTDDWVTHDSVTTEQQLTQSYDRFRAMDHLGDRTRKYKPWIAAGTNYHYRDCYKRIEEDGNWLVLRLPAHTGSPKKIFDIVSLGSPRTPEIRKRINAALRDLEKNPPGKLNFPKMLDWKELYDSAYAEGPIEYGAQMLLDPMPEGEQRFDHEALDDSWVDQIPLPEEMHIYIRADPAISEKKSAADMAIIVGGVRWDGARFLIDGWVGREKRPNAQVRKMFTLARKWIAKGYSVETIGIEDVAYQKALKQLARDGVPEREGAYHGESVPIMMPPCRVVGITRGADTTKHERILEMDGPVVRRELKFWTRCDIAHKSVQQFKAFPFDKFDILDAIHDLWVKVKTPPRPTLVAGAGMPPFMQKLLKEQEKEGRRLCGGNNSVTLSHWG